MFILSPDKYLLPDYKISPFQTRDIEFNRSLPSDESADNYFRDRFKGRDFAYTVNGRSALNKALYHYQLRPNDTVTILTTSGNFYVSHCVTGEVEKFCAWNREVTPATRVIIVVHEFGYPYEGWSELLSLNIPIIEDCAYAFFSNDEDRNIGNRGDFVVYSFPKMFPMQIGGLLTCKPGYSLKQETWPQSGMEGYIKQVISHYVKNSGEIIRKRLDNYRWLNQSLGSQGFSARFNLKDGVVPGVYMFQVNREMDLPGLKDYLFLHGIQCSVFYGENAFFVPNHQALGQTDLEYITAVIQSFAHEN